MVCTALKTSVDALEATGQVAAPDLGRLHDTLYALESLTYFQGNMARVRGSVQLEAVSKWPFSSHSFPAAMHLGLPCLIQAIASAGVHRPA